MKTKTKKPAPKIINLKKGFGSPEYGSFHYRNKSARMRASLDENFMIFNFYWKDTGLSFDFRIEGKKEVSGFVKFIQQAYEYAGKRDEPIIIIKRPRLNDEVGQAGKQGKKKN